MYIYVSTLVTFKVTPLITRLARYFSKPISKKINNKRLPAMFSRWPRRRWAVATPWREWRKPACFARLIDHFRFRWRSRSPCLEWWRTTPPGQRSPLSHRQECSSRTLETGRSEKRVPRVLERRRGRKFKVRRRRIVAKNGPISGYRIAALSSRRVCRIDTISVGENFLINSLCSNFCQ